MRHRRRVPVGRSASGLRRRGRAIACDGLGIEYDRAEAWNSMTQRTQSLQKAEGDESGNVLY